MFITNGFIGGLSGLTAGAAYYLSATVAGALTPTAPTIAVRILVAKSAKVAIVGISSPDAVTASDVSALSSQITQSGHGFILGDIVGSTPAGLWEKVTADDYVNLNAMAIVSEVIDSNNVVLTFEGLVLGVLSGLSLGVRYYLSPSTPGGATPIKPMGNSVQVFTCVNGTAGGSDGTDIIIHPFHAMGFASDIGLVVYQAGHGFSIGDALVVDTVGDYQLAQATNEVSSNVIGLVGEVRDTDHFTLVSEGFIPNTILGPGIVGSPFSPGIPYYLSSDTPGGNTATEPIEFAIKLFTYIDPIGIYVQIDHLSDVPSFIGYAVHEPGHGFVVGEAVRVNGVDTYTRAKANTTETAKVAGIVGAVLGIDDFFLITSGRLTGLTSIIDDTLYYLSDTIAGAVVTTPPAIAVQLYEGINTTSAIVNIRPTPVVNSITQVVTQFSHSFIVGDVLRSSGAGTYAKAQADTPTHALALGVVTEVIDSDTFVMTMAGLISGLSGLVTGAPYYLDASTAGAVTVTAPGSNVVAVYEATSTTQAIVKIVLSGSATPEPDISTIPYSGTTTGIVLTAGKVYRVIIVGGGQGGQGPLSSPVVISGSINYYQPGDGGYSGQRVEYVFIATSGMTLDVTAVGNGGNGGAAPSGVGSAGGTTTVVLKKNGVTVQTISALGGNGVINAGTIRGGSGVPAISTVTQIGFPGHGGQIAKINGNTAGDGGDGGNYGATNGDNGQAGSVFLIS